MKFGEKLKILRVLEGFTQNEMAVATQQQQSTFTRYEQGDVKPQSGPLLRICEILGQNRNIGWFQGKSKFINEGLAIYRPMSPYSTYTAIMGRSIDNSIADLLPLFVQETGLVAKVILRSQYGSVFLAEDDDTGENGIAVVCRPEISDALFLGFPTLDRNQVLSDLDALNLLLTPDFATVKRVLGLSDKMIGAAKEIDQVNVAPAASEDIITFKIEGETFSDQSLKDVESLIQKYFSKSGTTVNISVDVERQGTDPVDFENLIDPKIWKNASVDYKYDTATHKVVKI